MSTQIWFIFLEKKVKNNIVSLLFYRVTTTAILVSRKKSLDYEFFRKSSDETTKAISGREDINFHAIHVTHTANDLFSRAYRSHIHGSSRRFLCRLNLMNDPYLPESRVSNPLLSSLYGEEWIIETPTLEDEMTPDVPISLVLYEVPTVFARTY
jgi:hypothetical protein